MISVVIVVTLTMLCTAIPSDAADGPAVFYDDEFGIKVDFATGGTHIDANGDLVFTVSSDTYDMRVGETGLSFFECDDKGNPDMAKPRKFTHHILAADENSVTYLVMGIDGKVLLDFSDSILRDGNGSDPTAEEFLNVIFSLSVALVSGILMLGVCIHQLGRINTLIASRE